MINLFHLKYFYDACRNGSITKAAQENWVGRSAVSQAIMNLEKQIGRPLLIHQQRKFALTNGGEALFQKCRLVFEAVQSISEDTDFEASIQKVPIRVGTSLSLGKHFLSSRMQSFRSVHENCRFDLRLGTTLEMAEAVIQNQIDLAIVVAGGVIPGLKNKRLHNGFFVCVGSSQEKHSDYFLTEDRPETGAFIKFYAQAFGRAPRILDRVASWDYLSHLTEQGYGRSVLPDFMVQGQKKFKNVHPKFKHPYQVHILYRHIESLPEGARSFFDHLIESGFAPF